MIGTVFFCAISVYKKKPFPEGNGFGVFGLIDSRAGRRESRGIPRPAGRGQPARLDRAGPQARTRLSPAGGMALTACPSCRARSFQP